MSKKSKNIKLGFALLLMWCFVSAASRVLTGKTEQQLNPVFLCFYITLLANILFIVCCVGKFEQLFSKSVENFKTVLGINIATFGCWFFLFFPFKFLEPAIVSTLTLCVTPFATLMIEKYIHKKNSRYHDYTIAVLLLLMACYLVIIGFLGKTAVQPISGFDNILSIISCIIVSFSLAISNILAKKLSNDGFTPIETLTIRFILLSLLSGVIVLFSGENIILHLSAETSTSIITISLGMLVIPQIFYQNAIRELQPISISFFLPLMPVMVFFMEYYDARLQPNLYTICGIFIVFILSILSSFLRYQKERSSVDKNNTIKSIASN